MREGGTYRKDPKTGEVEKVDPAAVKPDQAEKTEPETPEETDEE